MRTRQLFATLGMAAILAVALTFRPYETGRLRPVGKAIVFTDRSGLPLGTILGSDERHAVAVPLDRISPYFLQALLAAEDRRFFEHQAIDGRALVRAVTRSVTEGGVPHGGSTIAMQLARLIEPVPPTVWGKVREIVDAQRLENTFDKRSILEAYCGRAPMGSNIYGVEAAARTYFGVGAADLDLAQAALLAGLPNDPVQLDPYVHPARAKARQRYVLAHMVSAGSIDPVQAANAAEEHLTFAPRGAGIFAGAHYLFKVAAGVPDGQAVVQTTLDRPLQQFVEAQARDVVAQLAGRNVQDAAAIVIDNATGDVRAYVGSPDYFDDARLGRNDGARALRQPGSTLKPFLYALALERAAIASNTILRDTPVTYALPDGRLYEPADYSQRYLGPVRVRIALANSLNVPAVRLLEQTGVNTFLERLQSLGFTHLSKGAGYYGLGLALGGGEVTLEELAHAYARLARSASPSDLLVTDMLADAHARASAFGVDSILALPFPAAVKTGTSSGHRDTWTAGFTRDYTVATWVGNFDGSAMDHVSGISGAAPLWARIMLHLHEKREPGGFEPPPGYHRAAICARTGGQPDRTCDAVVMEYLPQHNRAALPEFRAALHSPVLFPADGDRFAYYSATRSPQRLRLAFDSPPTHVSIDSRTLTPTGDAYVWAIQPGDHVLRATTARGPASVHFSVGPPLAPLHRGFTN